MLNMNAASDYHALQTAFTKRFSDQWQASATYTLSRLWDCDPLPRSGLEIVTFEVAPDLGGECSLATSDQRHRAVFNGIWELPFGFQTERSLLLRLRRTLCHELRRRLARERDAHDPRAICARMAPSFRATTSSGRQSTAWICGSRNGSRLAAALRVDAAVDVFNVFNHANYGAYTTQESSANYGKPDQSNLTAHAPRSLQLGFKVTF